MRLSRICYFVFSGDSDNRLFLNYTYREAKKKSSGLASCLLIGIRVRSGRQLSFWLRFADGAGLHRASVAATAVVWTASVGFTGSGTAAGACVLRHCT